MTSSSQIFLDNLEKNSANKENLVKFLFDNLPETKPEDFQKMHLPYSKEVTSLEARKIKINILRSTAQIKEFEEQAQKAEKIDGKKTKNHRSVFRRKIDFLKHAKLRAYDMAIITQDSFIKKGFGDAREFQKEITKSQKIIKPLLNDKNAGR